MRHVAFNDGWRVRPKPNRFAERAGQAPGWAPVTLPHDAMIGAGRVASGTAATGYFPGGVWEYEKTFDVAAGDQGTVVVLDFEGVYRDAVVWVNGELAARRPYGYSEFAVEIGHVLRFGAQNTIRVEARSHQDSRWYTGAGLYRPVWLATAGPVHLAPDDLVVRTPEVDDDGAVVTVAAVVRNRSATRSDAVLRTELVGPDGALVASGQGPVTIFPGDELTVSRRLFVTAPERWGIDHPSMYTCRLTLLDGAGRVLDEESTSFGIRTLSLDPVHGLRINGETVKLRGACVHHDNGPIGAATIDRAEERRIELLKAGGFNAIRSAHNPMSRAMLRACDQLGVVVMDEAFDTWVQAKSDDDYSLRFDDWWRADVEAMVRKDVNHPSVVFYSIGNEIPEAATGVGLHAGRALAEAVRELDDTRYVTQAVNGMLVCGPEIWAEIRDIAEDTGTDEETGINTAVTNVFDSIERVMTSPRITEATDELFSYVDLAGYNYMQPRYRIDRELFPDRVIVGTESHPVTIDRGWAEVLANSHVVGDFTWTGWDYIGEAGIGRVVHDGQQVDLGAEGFLGEYPWLTAWCGDLDICGGRRPQSYYREIVFGLRSDPYVAVHHPARHGRQVVYSGPWSWADVVESWTWDGYDGAPVTVEVYADADEVELLANGRSLGRRPAGPDHRYRAEFEATYEPGVLEAVAWRDGKELGRMQLRSASGPVLVDVQADRTEIAAEPSDLAFVALTLVDAAGARRTNADRPVKVNVDGPGVLEGLASANPRSEEPFTADTCTTFEGRALAVVRPTGAGTITVTASAEGCDARQVRITARSLSERRSASP